MVILWTLQAWFEGLCRLVCLKWPRDIFKVPQVGFKMPQDGLKLPRVGLELAQVGSKLASSWLKLGQSWLQVDLSWAQDQLREPPGGSPKGSWEGPGRVLGGTCSQEALL